MKKGVILSIVIFALILSISSISKSSALVSDEIEQTIEARTGINPDDLPRNENEIKEEITNKYLKQEWGKLIEKSPFMGPIHRSLIRFSPLFVILMGESYDLSWTFFTSLIIWIILFFQITEMVGASGALRGEIAALIGLGAAIVLAQVRLIHTLSMFIISIVSSQENWWIRSLILVGIVIFYGFLHVITSLVKGYLKKKGKNNINQEIEEKLDEMKGISKGLKEKD